MMVTGILEFWTVFIVFSVLSITLTLWENEKDKDKFLVNISIWRLIKVFIFMNVILIVRYKLAIIENKSFTSLELFFIVMINMSIAFLYIYNLKDVNIGCKELGLLRLKEINIFTSLFSLFIGMGFMILSVVIMQGIPFESLFDFLVNDPSRYQLDYLLNELFTNAITEELIFRGALYYMTGLYLEQNGVKGSRSLLIKNIIITTLFVLTHPDIFRSIDLLLYIITASTIFNIVREKSKNIYIPIIIHAYANFLTLY